MSIRLNQLDIGTRLSKDQVPQNNEEECATTPSQSYPCVKLKVEGVKFEVGYDQKRRVRYLSTQDEQFATKEGLHVGNWMKVREDNLFAIKGWKIFGPKTKSGWRPVVGYFTEEVQFRDGTVVDLSQPRHTPLRTGEVQILELEKGGV